MKTRKLRLQSTTTVTGVDKEMSLDVEICQTSKLMPRLQIKDTIDQYEQYEKEINECDKYRLFFTIEPYCTNVLFNILTEITKDEGSKDCKCIDGKATTNVSGAYGNTKPTRLQMIRNTEYSNPKHGYEYKPGYDFFNNHLLRSKTFKIISLPNSSTDKTNFNTIADFSRRLDGGDVNYISRQDANGHLHMYNSEEIMTFDESINNNIMEENGWWGFINSSRIASIKVENNGKEKITDLGISLPLNNKGNCEFVDMYPDRTLFSFNPKYNDFRKRLEYNWDLCLTYPYKSERNTPLTMSSDGEVNALRVARVEIAPNNAGSVVIYIYTFTKHNMKRLDTFNLYFDATGSDKDYHKTNETYKVYNVGDPNNDNEEYCFSCNDINLFYEIYGTDDYIPMLDEDGNVGYYKFDNNGDSSKPQYIKTQLPREIKDFSFRIARIASGHECQYYLRKFHKLPNFKYAKVANPNVEEIEGNDWVNADKYNFAREQYRLAFANTIYGDNLTQLAYSDAVSMNNLKDNLGRPLTQIYMTIIKRNQGNKLWYEQGKYGDESVEFSHCFGDVNSGIYCFNSGFEGSLRRTVKDVCVLSHSDGITNNITIHDNEFDGDIVEFSVGEYNETILAVSHFRFNTYQRDYGWPNKGEVGYDELKGDDFSFNFGVDFINFETDNPNVEQRSEGYHYKAHYPIEISRQGELQQDSNYLLPVKSIHPIQDMGIYLQFKTSLKHGLSVGDKLLIQELDEDIVSEEVIVTDTPSSYVFNIAKPSFKDNKYNYISFCQIMNRTMEERRFKVYRKNQNIPNYAVESKPNMFLWRNVLNTRESISEGMEDYSFSNGHIYIHTHIPFKLMRQDPHNMNGLYCSADVKFPNDVSGITKPVSSKSYKTEENSSC